ncbi:MAG: PocR ligand-binding domain-containing protein [Lachnospiraceae bacterium]|nr:PocR ligand-binding domain-containing protein [Lachnospiraceae bacterium]
MTDVREIDPRELNDLYLTDLMPVDVLQRIQDAFSNMAGMAALTTDAKGKAVTQGSNFTEYCMELIRKSTTGCRRCEECDRAGALATLKTGHSATYRCHAGLIDFSAPITIQGKMIGSFIGGQVLPKAPEEDKVRAVAAELGIDSDTLWEEAKKVPVRDPEEIEMQANFLYVLAGVLSEMAYGRYMAVKAGEEIERAAHMKSDFLANMSHEIRTPMNAVIGLAEMALRENLPPLAKEYINQIKNSGRALLNIINDILDFSKIEAGKMDIMPVEYETLSIINDVANMMQVKLKDKDVELLLDINPNFPAYVEGDNLRIKQVLTNIVNNAIKFTNSGYVKIRMDFSNIDEEHIKLRFFVEDTGIGIKEEDIGKLFQSFNQVDSKRNRNVEGTGLGLAISKQLLTLMGGNISVQSVYGEGSMFYFYLPQKVVDRSKAIVIKEPDKKFVMCNFNTIDLRTQFMKDIARFGIAHQEMTDWQDVIDHLEQFKGSKPKDLYIFTEKKCQDDTMNEILMKYPDISMIMVEDFFMDEKSMFPNLRILKKPLSAILISMVLNGDETISLEGDADAYTIDFVAPDAKILLVDDNSINLTVAEGLMEPMKMHVTSVTSGKEALKRIESEQFDIIFMDHMMPELDGVETTRLIRRFHPNYDKTPIIALTANAIEGAKSMFLSEGMQDVVTKPIEVRFLAMKLKQWLPPEKIQKPTDKDKEEAAAVKPAAAGELDLNTAVIADLDTASARQLLGNDKLYLNILKKFYESIGNKAMAIKKFYDDQDIHAYTIAVHALKSEARQIGAKELSDMAAELEKAGNANDMRIIREKTAHVLKKYLMYQQDLRPFFGGEDENAESKPALDDATLKEQFEKLAVAVDELDMDGMEEVSDKLKEFGYKGEEEKLCKELLEAISEMDVDACVEIMEKWRQVR